MEEQVEELTPVDHTIPLQITSITSSVTDHQAARSQAQAKYTPFNQA